MNVQQLFLSPHRQEAYEPINNMEKGQLLIQLLQLKNNIKMFCNKNKEVCKVMIFFTYYVIGVCVMNVQEGWTVTDW